MKINSLAALLALLLLSVTSLGQLSNGGEVVGVIDGRTVAIATRNGQVVKVELQYIQVPVAGHQLHDTVKGHLQKMLVGKAVEFKPRVILLDRVIGRVFLNNVDVSQQMLRDGAAMQAKKELSGQDKNEFDVYASIEAVAKSEKRGVWSTENIATKGAEYVNPDPPRPVLAAVRSRGSSPVPAVPDMDVSQPLESWVTSLPLDGKATTNLQTHTDPSGTYTSISTPTVVLEFSSARGKQAVECRALYAGVSSMKGHDEPMFLLGFQTKGAGSMTVVAERYVVPLAPVEGTNEIRYYRISKAFLMRIANTRSVELQLNGFKATLSEEAKEFFNQLLAASE